MKYPKKLEINIENDAQAAILYSCFNHSTEMILKHMGESNKKEIRAMVNYFKGIQKYVVVGDYIKSCWGKVNDIFFDKSTTHTTVPKFNVLLAPLEKSGITKEVVSKKKSKDNIAKIVVEMNEHCGVIDLKIAGFKNIKNRMQLPRKYFENFPQFFLIADNALRLSFIDNMGVVETHTFHIGDFCNKMTFEMALGKMKKAGKRLTQINREEKQSSIPKVVTKEFSI